MKRFFETLSGAIAVYVVVAACSGTGDHTAVNAEPDGSANGGHGGASAVDSGNVSGSPSTTEAGLIDRIVEPVGDAQAQDAPTEPVYVSGTRIRAQWLTGADGSKQFKGWWDSELGTECSYQVASDGVTRCLPEHTEGDIWFSDSTCQTPALVVNAELYPCVAGWATDEDLTTATCAQTLHGDLYRITGELSQAYYTGAPGACNSTPAALSGSQKLYGLEPAVPATGFVAATISTD